MQASPTSLASALSRLTISEDRRPAQSSSSAQTSTVTVCHMSREEYAVLAQKVEQYANNQIEIENARKAQAEARAAQNLADINIARAREIIAQADAKIAQADAKIAQANAKIAQADAKGAQADAKGARADARIAQADAQIQRAQAQKQASQTAITSNNTQAIQMLGNIETKLPTLRQQLATKPLALQKLDTLATKISDLKTRIPLLSGQQQKEALQQIMTEFQAATKA